MPGSVVLYLVDCLLLTLEIILSSKFLIVFKTLISQSLLKIVLSYGLHGMNLASIDIYATSYNVEKVVAKRPLIKEQSFILWHKRLGHISKERVERLIRNNILPTLDFSDLETCIDYCRGKLTKIKKRESTRSSDLLEIIHIDINGPYSSIICNS